MNVYRRHGSKAHPFLTLALVGVSSQFHAVVILPLGKEPLVLLG